MQMEWEIQKQIEERSHKIVQGVLQRTANQIMPPTPSEAARASLSQCFQRVMTTTRTKPAPPPEQPKGRAKEAPAQYSLADPFAGINPSTIGCLDGRPLGPAQQRQNNSALGTAEVGLSGQGKEKEE